MRADLKMVGIDPESGDPVKVYQNFKAWRLEDFSHPLKRMAATNFVRQLMVTQLCKPNDSRANPDLPHEKVVAALVKELQAFIAQSTEWQHRIDSVRDPMTRREGFLWFEKNHREILRRFEQYLMRQDLAG